MTTQSKFPLASPPHLVLCSEWQQQCVVVAAQQQAGERIRCCCAPQLHGAQQEGVEAGEEVTGAAAGRQGGKRQAGREGGKNGRQEGRTEIMSWEWIAILKDHQKRWFTIDH